jgi:mannose-1-phosphate guanylyltransferase
MVLLAGGRGTRFWPRSRRALPKQCLVLDGDRTLVQQTLDRIRDLVPMERVVVVTGAVLAGPIAAQLPELPAENILVEPRGRNTAPSLAWAAAFVASRGGTAMVCLPSDHRIEDAEEFRGVVRTAVVAARESGDLVLLGQSPTRPATSFGYLHMGEQLAMYGQHPLRRVQRFVEKPALADAERMVAGGQHLWNGGMFVWTTASIIEAFRATLPATARVIDALLGGASIQAVWDQTDATSIDYGVLERWSEISAIPCSFGWSDLGGWEAMADLLPASSLGSADVAGGVTLDGSEHVVYAPSKLVATLGVERLVVVDTDDVLLVCARDRAEEIPKLLALLAAQGDDHWL